MPQKIYTNNGKLDCSQQKRPAETPTSEREVQNLVSPTGNRLPSSTSQGRAAWEAGREMWKNRIGSSGVHQETPV
jgi:hypothetical protein